MTDDRNPRIAAFDEKYGVLGGLVRRSIAMVGVAGQSRNATRVAQERERHAAMMKAIEQLLAALPD
jgi:hypothetical protein